MNDADPRYLEAAVLGSMILNPQVIPQVQTYMLGNNAFYDPIHKTLYQCIVDIYDECGKVDIVLMRDWLERNKELAQVGGVDYLVKVLESVPSAASWQFYADKVKDRNVRRKLSVFASNVQTMSTGHEPATVILSQVEAKLRHLITDESPTSSLVSFDRLPEAIDAFDNDDVFIPTGFGGLDARMYGLSEGDFIVVGGRPGMGKTSFMVDIALNLANRMIPIIFFSVEMPWIQLHQRILCSMADVDLERAMKGQMSVNDFRYMRDAGDVLKKIPFYIDDTPGLTPTLLKAKTIQYKSKHNVKAVFIDYFQKMKPDRTASQYEELSRTADSIAMIAREEQIPTVIGSQLNRDVESRVDKKPRMSDLKGTGSLEDHANAVILLYREDYYSGGNSGDALALIKKLRRGRPGEVPLLFDARITKFKETDDGSGDNGLF